MKLVLDERQFSHLTSLAAYFKRFALWERYKGRPDLKPPERPDLLKAAAKSMKQAPQPACADQVQQPFPSRAMWRYALQCTLLDLQEAKAGTIAALMRKRRVRQAYVQIAKHLRGKSWRPPLAAQMLMREHLDRDSLKSKMKRDATARSIRMLGPPAAGLYEPSEPSSSRRFAELEPSAIADGHELKGGPKSLALLEVFLRDITNGGGGRCLVAMRAGAFGEVGVVAARAVESELEGGLRAEESAAAAADTDLAESMAGPSPTRGESHSVRDAAGGLDRRDRRRFLCLLLMASRGAARAADAALKAGERAVPGEALESAVGALSWLALREIEDESSTEELVLWRKMAELELTLEEIKLRTLFGGDEAYAARLTPRRSPWTSKGGLFRLSRWPWQMATARPPAIGSLRIYVESARGLPGADAGGTSSDPYVQFYLGGSDEAARTATKFRTLSPEWRETFELRVERIDQMLHVLVMDDDTVSSDDVLGE